jgi:hypothetical protein
MPDTEHRKRTPPAGRWTPALDMHRTPDARMLDTVHWTRTPHTGRADAGHVHRTPDAGHTHGTLDTHTGYRTGGLARADADRATKTR